MYNDPEITYHHGLPDPDIDAQFYAGVTSKRLVAWVIDTVVIAAITMISVFALAVLTLGFGLILTPVVVIVVSFAYRSLSIASRSATWGMRAMGIEFRNRHGNRFEKGEAMLHTGVYMLLVISFIGWLISVISMLNTRLGQGLPDLLVGSTAINRPVD